MDAVRLYAEVLVRLWPFGAAVVGAAIGSHFYERWRQ